MQKLNSFLQAKLLKNQIIEFKIKGKQTIVQILPHIPVLFLWWIC